MAAFLPAVEKVLSVEGGYQNDTEDWGNYNAYDEGGNYVKYAQRKGRTLRAGTNRGISAGLLSSLYKRQVTAAEMQAIAKQQAIDIYKKIYWDGIQGDHIPNQALAELIFDGHVNHGTTGKKLTQKVLNGLGANPPLAIDGAFGPQTMTAIKKAPLANLFNNLLQARAELYKKLVQDRPDNAKYFKGWMNRLKKFPVMTIPTTGKQWGAAAGVGVLLYFLLGKS